MTRKYIFHIPQTNVPRHREEDTQKTDSHMTRTLVLNFSKLIAELANLLANF